MKITLTIDEAKKLLNENMKRVIDTAPVHIKTKDVNDGFVFVSPISGKKQTAPLRIQDIMFIKDVCLPRYVGDNDGDIQITRFPRYPFVKQDVIKVLDVWGKEAGMYSNIMTESMLKKNNKHWKDYDYYD